MSREAINIIIIVIVGAVIIIIIICVIIFNIIGVSVGDSIRLFRLGDGGEGGLWVGVVLEYHGGLGGMGIKNAMVDGVRSLEVT